jgi:pimeloyl-ACP methyl ester carboxylesterase
MHAAYLGLAGDYNVIVVDWASLAKAPLKAAANNTRIVGLEIAKLIDALILSGKASLRDFHHIGHSLGAQVGAFISTNLAGGTSKLPRVTGLDPGRPGFENSAVPPSERLDPTDADFVDVITTSCGVGCKIKTPDPPRGTVDRSH